MRFIALFIIRFFCVNIDKRSRAEAHAITEWSKSNSNENACDNVNIVLSSMLWYANMFALFVAWSSLLGDIKSDFVRGGKK